MKRAYYNLRLFDGISNGLQEGQSVLVDGNKIVEIRPINESPTPEYELIDLGVATLMPGLMDLHVHITAPLMTEFRGKEALMALEPQRRLNLKAVSDMALQLFGIWALSRTAFRPGREKFRRAGLRDPGFLRQIPS